MKTIQKIEKEFDSYFKEEDDDIFREHIYTSDIKQFYRKAISEILDSLVMEKEIEPHEIGNRNWNDCREELLSRINKIKEGL